MAAPKPDPTAVSFKPLPSRNEPAIWVRNLSVWSHWPPSKDSELRTITLHRGLNILWAESKNDPDEPRIGGHGAGKTTFCRFLRFVLDERHPGTTEFRQDFRRIHPDGWVLAEVIVDGEPWLVGKTLSERGRAGVFAVQGGSIEQAFEAEPPIGGYEDYQKALDAATVERLEIRELSGSRKPVKWVHLLSWLARDQEAHYANLLAWRDPASEPEGQDLSALDRENLILLVMGLVEEKRQNKLTERATAGSNHTAKLENRVPLNFNRKRARETLGEALGKNMTDILGGEEADSPDDPILLQEVESKATTLENEAATAILEAKLEDEEKAAELHVEAAAGIARIQRGIRNSFRQRLNKLLGNPPVAPKPSEDDAAPDAQLMALAESIGELQGRCNRMKNEAADLGCPHYRESKPDANTEKAIFIQEEQNDEDEAEKRRQIEYLTRKVDDETAKLSPLEKTETEARTFLANVKIFVEAERKRLSAPAGKAKEIRDALEAYQKECRESQTLAEDLAELDRTKTILDKEIADMAAAQRDVVLDFELLYDALAKRLLGDKVTGEVKLKKGIEPDLKYHGRRKSAALNLSKLLTFDLACLALGMTSEHAFHPRFVIHDSPREADLAIGIYHALFRTARMLEDECDGEPAFQYIVTTTESPPEEFKVKPWLLQPVLDATVAEKRFLGADL